MSYARPFVPPVLSRSVSRVIALPTRSVPHTVPHGHVVVHEGRRVESSGGALPHRLSGERGASSSHLPTHADVLSTLQPQASQGLGNTQNSGSPLIDLDGTYTVAVPGYVQVAHISLLTPQPVTAYIMPVPGAVQDNTGSFRLIARISVGKGKSSHTFYVDIPTYIVGSSAIAGTNGVLVAIPLVCSDLNISVRIAKCGPAQTTAFLNATDTNNPPNPTPAELSPPGANPTTYTVRAFIAQEESTPRGRPLAGRHTAALVASGGGTLTANPAQGCDSFMILADPTGTITGSLTDVTGNVTANLPVNTILPIGSTSMLITATNGGAANHFLEICQFLSFM